MLGPPGGRRRRRAGWPAWLLRPGFSREPSPAARPAAARTPAPRGARARAEAVRARPRGPHGASSAARGAPGRASTAPALLPAGRKFTWCSELNSESRAGWGGREAGCVLVPHAPTALGLCGGMRCPGGVRSWPEAGDPCRGAGARRPGVTAQRRAHFAAGAERGRCPDPAPRVHLRIFPSPQYMHPSPPNAPDLVLALGRSWRPELETAPGRSPRVVFPGLQGGEGE